MNKIFLLFIYTLFSNSLMSFSIQRTTENKFVKWRSSFVSYNINIDNKLSLSDDTIKSIFESSFSEWSEGPVLTKTYSTSAEQVNSNDIYFEDDSLFFSGSSVLAVTKNTYNESTGEIVESDIIIRNNIFLNNDSSSQYFLGNIITHELGHSMGLGHSNELFSSMFYSVFRGQHTSSHDDLHGTKLLYKENTSEIKGTIAGSSDQFAIFGATVKLISGSRGKVVASALSELNGEFHFKDIESDDVYYIYVEPTKYISPLPSVYAGIRNDFCPGFVSYQGGFYETCDARRRGKPQGIKIDSVQKKVDVGVVSIKCHQELPLGYFDSKQSAGFNITNNELVPGESIVGFFSEEEVNQNSEDTFHIDLSHYDASAGDLYLDVSVIAHELYSKSSYEVEVESPVSFETFRDSVDEDGNPRLNVGGVFPLDASNSLNNSFTIKVIPKSIDDFLMTSSFVGLNSLFPEFENLGSDKAIYQLIVQIKRRQGLNYILHDHYDYSTSTDNSSCMQGEKAFSIRTPASTIENELTSEESSAVACGSINLNGGSGPGSGRALVQVLLVFLLVTLLTRKNKDKKLLTL